jgi:hypothetical protein
MRLQNDMRTSLRKIERGRKSPQFGSLPPIPQLPHACTNPVHSTFGQVRITREDSYFDKELSRVLPAQFGQGV